MQRLQMSNADCRESISLQRGPSAALVQQQSTHSMQRTASGPGGSDEKGHGAQGKRPSVRRQGSSGMSQGPQGSLQSMLNPIQGMIVGAPCLVGCFKLQHVQAVMLIIADLHQALATRSM